ncbi:MAG: DUF389 domain-containing protein [Deltaproteobacteria bacterium]|nr:DUF389 domain-containing protein [Deltaproteobacteria bacterium]
MIARARGQLSAIVGVTPETRMASARSMLERHGTDRFGYWLQLVLSMGIATYGLVLGSTGVVIGAMLVSPLMGPLVEIGMGLVVGSPLLVVHSLLRTALSTVVVVGLSAVLTLALPYHEATPEIAARTSPTLLDLYVACFCALAGAYTTVRRGSDTVTAAAGTAISIALVPPLCVVGWGLGSGNARAWHGAMLLFTANFCAIILFSVVVFLLLAFDTIDVSGLERDAGRAPTGLDHIAVRLRHFFGSRYSHLLRLLMPLALAAAVFVPLRSALNEVAWTVKTRGEVQKLLDGLPPAKRAVRSLVSIDQHAVSIRLLIVGDTKSAAKIKRDLETQVAAVAGVMPSVEVVAVPDADAIRIATERLAMPPPMVAPQKPDVDLVAREIDAELRSKWPASAVGELLTWRMVVRPGGDSAVELVHFGKGLGRAGELLLANGLSERVGRELTIHDVAMSEVPVTVAADRWLEWLPALASAVDQAVEAKVAYVCISSASSGMKGTARERASLADERIKQSLSRLDANRFSVRQGDEWSVALSATPCPAESAPSDAGRD